ncbi:MAG: hypothetical protein IPP47_06175 [Bryobacterales bacterium]|nr:hypothetical protein [Bryobacterales bacterium]
MLRRKWQSTFAVVLIGFLPALAQQKDLSTDRHGTKVVFSSTLSLRGEERNDWDKLMEARQEGTVRTLLSIQPVPSVYQTNVTTNWPLINQPELTSDGTGMAWTATTYCRRYGCYDATNQGSFTAPGVELLKNGQARISANGRWLLIHSPFGPGEFVRKYTWWRKDLSSGRTDQGTQYSYDLGPIAPVGRRVISNDGTFVRISGTLGLEVYRPDEPVSKFPAVGNLKAATISDDGRFIVGETLEPLPSLVGVDLRSGEEWPVVSADEGVRAPALSEDGTTLMFLSGANWLARNNGGAVQIWTMDLISGELEQWTEEPWGIREATLSGDGQVAWAATVDGRIVRVERRGPTREIIESSPWSIPIPTQPPYPDHALSASLLVPGSRYEIEGSGLQDARLTWRGLEIHPLEVTTKRLSFILPLEAEVTVERATLENPKSPFMAQLLFWDIVPTWPQFVFENSAIRGLRENGSVISEQNQPRGGERVTLSMRGLGPVDGEERVTSPLTLSTSLIPPGGQLEPVTSFEAVADPSNPGLYLMRFAIPHITSSGRLFVMVQDPRRLASTAQGEILVQAEIGP